jgi:hypothetical protein
LLPLVQDEETQVVWLDSDLMVTRDLLRLMDGAAPDVLVFSQEPVNQPHEGSAVRTEGWGLPVGRRIPWSLNSCVLRVTSCHRGLLERWRELLADGRYVRAQGEPIEDRPPHLSSDQDVLAALLGSAEFARVPLRVLRHGRDVLHTGGALGFTLGERIGGLVRPVPTVLHAIAGKPWVLLGGAKPAWGSFVWFRQLMQELSPYVAHARRYRDDVGEAMAWLDHRTATGRVLRVLGLGHWALRGLPVTLAATVLRRLRATRRGYSSNAR